ncbi:MAG: hypothetical protein EON91_02725 [Brevundimonas sp.]|uniref:hypothetical protein n=1 Tax=Brevundimonas sp. TaxID=1871086 RepID=UPI00120592D6|nr:hypothetical protein [Brevundimonas sp.]RZJ19128.1 MAG: hypothetical protein EON91_02725 [Brevundimonas sp.]
MLSDEVKAILNARQAARWSCFLHMQCKSSVVRAWTGIADFAIDPDEVDTTGGIYLGIGLVEEMPALKQLVGGLAERIEFRLNGADETTFQLADGDVDEVRGAAVNIGIVFFDEDWQPVAPIAWLWDGEADVPRIDRDGSGDQIVRTVTLSVGSAFTDRTRPQLAFYTPGDQKRRSATDTFCDRVPAYGVESTVKFPS